jgi:hypothetical protein
MPDTGAPWNLPYPAPSDLVRNGPAQFEALADAVADGLTETRLNFDQVMTTTDFTTTSATAVDLTGVTITVTPRAATNRFLLLFSANTENSNGGTRNFFQFQRDATLLFEEVEVYLANSNDGMPVFMMFDEEATNTTERTYKVVVRRSGNTMTVMNSSLIVIEYAP